MIFSRNLSYLLLRCDYPTSPTPYNTNTSPSQQYTIYIDRETTFPSLVDHVVVVSRKSRHRDANDDVADVETLRRRPATSFTINFIPRPPPLALPIPRWRHGCSMHLQIVRRVAGVRLLLFAATVAEGCDWICSLWNLVRGFF